MTHTSTQAWKAYSVFVENAPNQWHVGTGKWGAGSIAVVDTEQHAHLIAAAPELLSKLQMMVDVFNVAEIDPLQAFAAIEHSKGSHCQSQRRRVMEKPDVELGIKALRLPDDIHADLKAFARRNSRTMVQQVQHYIIQHVKEERKKGGA